MPKLCPSSAEQNMKRGKEGADSPSKKPRVDGEQKPAPSQVVASDEAGCWAFIHIAEIQARTAPKSRGKRL